MVAAARPKIVPNAYVLLSNWRYVEYALLRIIAGWGRCAGDWEDKLAVCYHVWLQAEIVDRLRKRCDMFPGGKPDAPVNRVFQEVCEAVLLAPSFEDAMAGVHELINPALVRAYRGYVAGAHPVHDRPTFDLLHEAMSLKAKQAEWYEGFRRRHPHVIDPAYRERIVGRLAALDGFGAVVELTGPYAKPCGVGSGFRMPRTPGRVKDWDRSPDIMPLLQLDWSRSVEARRLYFMIGYCYEMGVAERQLRWLYHAEFMPWDFVYAEARHMWDESRHGDSGLSRLRDFGLDLEHVRYSSYGASGEGYLEPMTPRDVYEAFYDVTQIAETGFFETKRYCFDDFRSGDDEASAEMMQYDIIDETSHVEYGRIWLEEMARRAGVEEDYRKRGAADRAAAQRRSDAAVAAMRRFLGGDRAARELAARAGDPRLRPEMFDTLIDPAARRHYEWMLSELRGQCPLKNADAAPVRPNLPM